MSWGTIGMLADHWTEGRWFSMGMVRGRGRIYRCGAVLVVLGVVASMVLGSTVSVRIPSPAVSGVVPSLGGPLLAAGLYGSFECLSATITLDGMVVCNNQTVNNYRLSGPGGGYFSFQLSGSPVSGNQTWGWIVSGGCLQSQSPCRTSSLSNPVELYAGCSSGQHCVVVVTYEVLTTPLYGNFSCQNSKIALNGTVVCQDQLGIQIPISGPLGGTFWYNLNGTPDPFYLFWGWNVSGGCLAGAICSGSTSDPVVLSASCDTGGHCIVYVTLVVVANRLGTTCYNTSQVTQTNWAGGYVVVCPNGYVTEATSSWILPSLECPANVAAVASFWTGIDGWPPGRIFTTVEQTGAIGICTHSNNGTLVVNYTAFYELYPVGAVYVGSITFHPGDKVSATVRYESTASNGSKIFGFVLRDGLQRWSANLWAPTWPQVNLSSAESIVEVEPVSNAWYLANFGTAEFGPSYTGTLACGATIDGVTAALGTFPGVEMVNGTGSVSGLPLAQTSAFTGLGSSFTVTWERYY